MRYPGYPYAQTHPDRLATLATLFGLESPALDGCRVLELGCGDGTNLVSMALSLPGASFVGVDAARAAVERGRALVAGAGLSNVALEDRTLEEFEPGSGSFDYVVAHGVYSWVAPSTRDRLLELCGSALSERGVAYVSYDALPGGRLKQMLRDMLLFHTAAQEDPAERLEQARALLAFLMDGWSAGHEFGALMSNHAERLLGRSDETLFHDELAATNEPVYFHQFAEHAARHGLQYLAEADFFEMQTGALPEEASELLAGVPDPLVQEQYLDFLKGRMFRQTLLCGAGHALDRSPRPQLLMGLGVSSPARPTQDRAGDGRTTIEGPSGATLTTSHPLVVQALERIGASWPGGVWVGDLLPDGVEDADRHALCDALLRCYAANLVHLHVRLPVLTTSVSERPEASPLARQQARAGPVVANLRHEVVRVEDELGRRLVTLLDGSRDRGALVSELRAYLLGAGLQEPPAIEDGLERSLEGVASLALLRA